MYGDSVISRRSRQRDERGTVAIVVAICLTLLCVVVAMVLDFGLVKVDRQVDKSAADSAVLAGLHAMDFTGGSTARPFVGVCAALRFLKANHSRFSGLSESSGWSDGNGTPIPANGCTDSTLQTKSCSAAKTTWARYEASQTVNGLTYTIRIQNGYDFADAGNWQEDSLSATSADHAANPCMDMELTVIQSRRPGLGSLATSSDLVTGIRTVGRTQLGSGGVAPAMLLLKRTGCSPNALRIGGNNSYIHVRGFVNGSISQPGTIHTDDDGGNGCAGNGTNQIFNGANVADSIVAYAAPLSSNPSTADPTKPGLITSVYGSLGNASASVTRDSFADVYGAGGLNETASGTHFEATGRSLVTRQPVDSRYLSTMKTIVSNSTPYFSLNFANPNQAHSANWGYATCANNGTIAANQIDAYDSTKLGLYVNCNGNNGVTGVPGNTIAQWKTVVFNGAIKMTGSSSLALPDATKVYIAGTGSNAQATAISIGSSFQMHTASRTVPQAGFADGFKCASTKTSDRGLLVAKTGSINVNGLFRACDTTVVLLGGDSPPPAPGACLVTYDPATTDLAPSTYPTHTPCASGNYSGAGTGQINVNGDVDWTAPNNCTIINSTTCDGVGLAAGDGWNNVNGPEDLALWSESAAYGSINATIGGSSGFNVRGVFMTPNFDPLNIGGSAGTTLLNAQFIATSLSLNGGAQLNMTVDPDSAVTLKRMQLYGLVR